MVRDSQVPEMHFKHQEERRIDQESSLLISNPDLNDISKFSPTNSEIIQSYNLPYTESKNPELVQSFHKRFIKYQLVRNRIFGNQNELPNFPKKLTRLLNFRKSSKIKRRCFNQINSLKSVKFSDNRPYAEVLLEGKTMSCLLDSGATIGALGNNSIDFLSKIERKCIPLQSKVFTADSTQQDIFGIIYLETKYKDITKEHLFYVIPSLKQEVYLGFDFFISFNIAPDLHALSVSEIYDPDDLCDPLQPQLDPPEPNQHSLTSDQTLKLEKIKRLFPSSTLLGLGQTNLITHRIETDENVEPIKCRHYPVHQMYRNSCMKS